MDCVYYAVNWFFYWAMFKHTNKIGDWGSDQVMVFVATTFVVDAFMMTIFMPNLWQLSKLINKGDLDYYIVRPVNSLFFVTLREFSANSFMNLVVAFLIFGYALSNLAVPLTLQQTAVLGLLTMNGAFLTCLIYLLHLIPIFWTQAPSGYHDLFWTLNQFTERPHKIFNLPIQKILMSVAPFALVASVPAQIAFDGINGSLLLNVVGVTVFFFALVVVLWNRGLKRYSSASS
jgi:ABC-2 type transport system permease protein